MFVTISRKGTAEVQLKPTAVEHLRTRPMQRGQLMTYRSSFVQSSSDTWRQKRRFHTTKIMWEDCSRQSRRRSASKQRSCFWFLFVLLRILHLISLSFKPSSKERLLDWLHKKKEASRQFSHCQRTTEASGTVCIPS